MLKGAEEIIGEKKCAINVLQDVSSVHETKVVECHMPSVASQEIIEIQKN